MILYMNYKKPRVGCCAHHNILWGLKNHYDSAMRHKGFCTSYVALGTPPLLNSSRPGPMPNLSLKLTNSFDSDSKVESIWFSSSKCLHCLLRKLNSSSSMTNEAQRILHILCRTGNTAPTQLMHLNRTYAQSFFKIAWLFLRLQDVMFW